MMRSTLFLFVVVFSALVDDITTAETQPIVSKGRLIHLFVQFEKSNLSFKISGTACFLRLEGGEGVLESPNYPADYPANQDCIYEIIRTSPSACGVRLFSN